MPARLECMLRIADCLEENTDYRSAGQPSTEGGADVAECGDEQDSADPIVPEDVKILQIWTNTHLTSM